MQCKMRCSSEPVGFQFEHRSEDRMALSPNSTWRRCDSCAVKLKNPNGRECEAVAGWRLEARVGGAAKGPPKSVREHCAVSVLKMCDINVCMSNKLHIITYGV